MLQCFHRPVIYRAFPLKEPYKFTTLGMQTRWLLRLFQERVARQEVNWCDFAVYLIQLAAFANTL